MANQADSHTSRYHAAWDNAEPQLRDVCRAAGLWGQVAVEVALAIARQQWIRRGSSGRLNANSSLRALDAGRLVEVIQQHTGKRRRRSNVNRALRRLEERGVIGVVAQVDRGGLHNVRVAVHLDPACLGRGIGAFNELGDCLSCPTGLRSADESGGPFGAGHEWRQRFGLPSEEDRRKAYSGVQIPLPLDYPESGPTPTESGPTSEPPVVSPQASFVKSGLTSSESGPTSTFKGSNDPKERSEESTGGGERSEAEPETAPPADTHARQVQVLKPDEQDRRRSKRKASSRPRDFEDAFESSPFRHLFKE